MKRALSTTKIKYEFSLSPNEFGSNTNSYVGKLVSNFTNTKYHLQLKKNRLLKNTNDSNMKKNAFINLVFSKGTKKWEENIQDSLCRPSNYQ